MSAPLPPRKRPDTLFRRCSSCGERLTGRALKINAIVYEDRTKPDVAPAVCGVGVMIEVVCPSCKAVAYCEHHGLVPFEMDDIVVGFEFGHLTE